jgi:single-stranded-DNA-specific exonuclease
LSEASFINFIESYKSFTIVPDSSLDSLLSAGVLLKNLSEHGWDVRVNLDPKVLLDYSSDPAILLNLQPTNTQKQLVLSSTSTSSVTALTVSLLEKALGGVDKWCKVLAVISGLYRGHYDFKAGGFKGLENSILSELASQKIVTEVVSLRLWGAKRSGLVSALARTLVPFIPGITGNLENASRIVREVLGVSDPSSVRLKEISGEEDVKKASALIKKVSEVAQQYAKIDLQLPIKLVGDFYIHVEAYGTALELEAHEVLGGLVVYESSCRECPLDIVVLPLSVDSLPQILAVYNSVVDYLAASLSTQLVEFLRSGRSVFECEESLQRPDLIVDVLLYHGIAPQNRAVSAVCDGEEVTVLRELLRVGVKPEEAYSKCLESQVCRVK